ncbi:hypothetical protein ACFSAV_05970 [Pasteurella oralis]|uniref:Uncharacterized protein n=1 Tax=Pasteurella oralis TaxID=1071947 RepID=A0ABW4NTG8_9PAST
MQKSIFTLAIVSLSTLLVACGGGGGGGGNSGNPSQPIQPAPKPAPDPAPQPKPPVPNPQPDHPADPNPMPDPMDKPKPPETMPKTNEWRGGCESSSQDICSAETTNQVKVYTLKTVEDSKVAHHEVTTETAETLTLTLGAGESKKVYPSTDSGSNYSFTLLSSNNTNGDVYYGYRQRANSNTNGKHYDFVYGYRAELANNNIPENYTANYNKSGGFIYSPFSFSNTANNNIKYTGDVQLSYKNGKVKGKIWGGQAYETIFLISGNGTNLTLESTNAVPNPIDPNQKGSINVHFIDSTKGANDHKYLVGTGKSQNGTDKTGWVGVLFAEKQ